MDTIYILGAGAIGFPLVASLAKAGRTVVAVRTSQPDAPPHTRTVTIQHGAHQFSIPVKTMSLMGLTRLDGTIVIATKAHANAALAEALKDKVITGPLVILQNGIGVEQPFLAPPRTPVYRGVLYVTSQALANTTFTVRPITASPIGIITGDAAGLRHCVDVLTTDDFPFRAEANIQREIWKKGIINVVFNSICPLLDVDNGVFFRDEAMAGLAREIVRECMTLTNRLNIGLSERELIDQVLLISQRSDGQLISTLQDLRSGRPTEMTFLNLEIARIAAELQPPLQLPRVELLGKMISAKSCQQRRT